MKKVNIDSDDKKEKKICITETVHNISFKVYRKQYYHCSEVDDVIDELLDIINTLNQEKKEIDQKLREYEANIAGILLDCQKIKNECLSEKKPDE